MNRKNFIRSSLAALVAAGLPVKELSAAATGADPEENVPPFLKPGDMIGVTSPAGYIVKEKIIPAVTLMQQWGFRVRTGDTIGKRDFTFGGTDAERLADFQKMLDAPEIKAIMCARGGYGSLRIVDGLSWDKFVAQPKWIIGFSDITILHAHISRNFGIATLHAKMCNSFPDIWEQAEAVQKETIASIRKALVGEQMTYTADAFEPLNKPGTATGILVGGNLKTIETLSGTVSDIDTDGKILFVEDTGEYLYSIDRMFWNLKRTGKLARLAGLIIGGMKIKQDPADEPFGKNLYDIVLEQTKPYSYPVCFDFPVGHQVNNYALRCGTRHRLSVMPGSAVLTSL